MNIPPGNQGFRLGETSKGCIRGEAIIEVLPRWVISVGLRAGEIRENPLAGGGMGEIMEDPGVRGTWRGVEGAKMPDPIASPFAWRLVPLFCAEELVELEAVDEDAEVFELGSAAAVAAAAALEAASPEEWLDPVLALA